MLKKIFFLSLFSIFLLSISVQSQSNIPVKITGKSEKLKVKAGESFVVKMTMDIPKGYYTYSIDDQVGPEGVGPLATFISVEPVELIALAGNIKVFDEHTKFDDAFKMKVKYYNGKARFEVPLKAKKNIDFSKDNIRIISNMQICKGSSCFPPEDYAGFIFSDLTATDTSQQTLQSDTETMAQMVKDVEGKSPDTVSASENASDNEIDADNNSEVSDNGSETSSGDKSLWSTIVVGLLAGLFSLTTPCVYPMVPITVSFFTKRAEQTKSKGLRDALAYAIGIILTFSLLGFIISLLFGPDAMQQLSTSPGINIFITAIFVIFALSLFGMFEMQLPTGLMNKLNMKSQQGSGIGSVILMGLTFSLASFSCTGPIVGAALIEASSGGWIHPIVSMLSFSTVLAAPFFLLALFPNAVSGMPKAGGWMNNIKVVLAFILIAVSLKFLNMAFEDWGIGFSRDLFLSIWVASSLLITIYLLGIFKMSHDSPVDKISGTRILFVIAFGAVTFYLATGFFGRNLGAFESFLPEATESSLVALGTEQQQDVWFENYDEAVKQAKQENKNIFIDFTGKHCTNCKQMERNMFSKASIQQEFAKLIKVKLITDLREEQSIANKNFQKKKFGTVAIPMYVLLTTGGKVIAIDHYNNSEESFANFLKKGTK